MSNTRRNAPSSRRKQAGLSLLGIIIAVVIIAAIAAYVLGQGRQAKNESTATTELQSVGQVFAKLESTKQDGSYGASGTDLSQILITGGGVPSTWQSSGTTLTNAFQGGVAIISTGPGFTLTLDALPANACLTLAKGVGGTSVMTTAINGGSPIAGKVTTNVAATQCSSDSNSITWTDNT